ncbi:MAG: glycosyltransferase family 39 protein, partial [Armatimonadota bacterium]
MAYSLFLLGEFCWWVLKCPYEVDYGEGIVLRYALNIARGRVVYNDYRHYPFVASTYPPVYPLICALGVKLSGVSFTFGRALSCGATLGVAALIWALLRRARAPRFTAALAAMLFLAAPIVRLWAPLMRVDMTAILFGLCGLYCVLLGGRWLVAAVVLMIVAIYTRQSEVAPLAAAVTYLWWIGERRNAVIVGASALAVTLVMFGTLQLATDGWFYRHIVVANQNLWDSRLLVRRWSSVLSSWPLPFILGVVGLAVAGWTAKGRPPGAPSERRPERLIGAYFVFALLVFLTAGKIGSGVNYMQEPIVAACLATGIAYPWLASRVGTWAGKVAWVAVWAVLILSLAAPCLKAALGHAGGEAPWRRKTIEGGRAAVDLIRRTKGDILSDDAGLLVIAGRPVLLDSHKMTSMFYDGHWDQGPLIQDIKRRRFALIISVWNPAGGASDEWGTYGNYRWSIGMGRA